MKRKRVIIAGSRGIVGRALTPKLATEFEVLALDLALGHDLRDPKFVREWFAANPADGLVNLFAMVDHVAAGGQRPATRLMDITLDSLREYFETNVITLFSVCREFARVNKQGSIVNFSSVYGVTSPIPTLYDDGEKHLGYGISKASVVQLTRHLSTHWAPKIRVNCVVPGGIRHQQDDKFMRAYSERTPMGRMAEADEITGLVRFLVAEDSSYYTGGVYPVDGGWTAW
ncbi:MAG: SDR family NAD(P)-dependent oxidoreductase [Bacteriovoracia bacterium]